jgi:hypothetical protein
MSELLTQHLLAVVLDDHSLDDDFVRNLARSADAHGELVRLATVLARLPGKGARAAELRLDHLLDEVALVAASQSRIPPPAADATHEPAVARSESRRARRLLGVTRPALAGAVIAAAVIVLVVARPTRDAKELAKPSGTEPAFVEFEVRVSPVTATISLDGIIIAHGPLVARHRRDPEPRRIDVTAPGYRSASVVVEFDHSVTLDVRLERSDLVADNIPEPPKPRFEDPPGLKQDPARAPVPAVVPSPAPADLSPAPSAAGSAVDPEPPMLSREAVVGRIMVVTNVRHGEILVDDVVMGRTPLQRPLEIAAGHHKLTVLAQGYLPLTRDIHVPAQETVQVELSLRSRESVKFPRYLMKMP